MIQRRDILRAGLRGGGLLALGGVAAALGWRTLTGPCVRRDPCGGCPQFSGCELPKAVQSKSAASATPSGAASNPRARSAHV